jgi:hypothetical protein
MPGDFLRNQQPFSLLDPNREFFSTNREIFSTNREIPGHNRDTRFEPRIAAYEDCSGRGEIGST